MRLRHPHAIAGDTQDGNLYAQKRTEAHPCRICISSRILESFSPFGLQSFHVFVYFVCAASPKMRDPEEHQHGHPKEAADLAFALIAQVRSFGGFGLALFI